MASAHIQILVFGQVGHDVSYKLVGIQIHPAVKVTDKVLVQDQLKVGVALVRQPPDFCHKLIVFPLETKQLDTGLGLRAIVQHRKI